MLTCFSALKRANTVPDEFTQYTGQIHTVLEGFTQYRTGSYGTRWIHTVPDGFTRYQTGSYSAGRIHTVPDGFIRCRTGSHGTGRIFDRLNNLSRHFCSHKQELMNQVLFYLYTCFTICPCAERYSTKFKMASRKRKPTELLRFHATMHLPYKHLSH